MISFHVQDVGDDGASSKGRYTGQVKGVVRPLLEWTTVADAPVATHAGAVAACAPVRVAAGLAPPGGRIGCGARGPGRARPYDTA